MKYINAEEVIITYRNLTDEKRSVYLGDLVKNLFSTATELGTLTRHILDKDIYQYNLHLIHWAQYYHGLLVNEYAYNNLEPAHISSTLRKCIGYLNHMEMSIQYLKGNIK